MTFIDKSNKKNTNNHRSFYLLNLCESSGKTKNVLTRNGPIHPTPISPRCPIDRRYPGLSGSLDLVLPFIGIHVGSHEEVRGG